MRNVPAIVHAVAGGGGWWGKNFFYVGHTFGFFPREKRNGESC